MEELMEIKNLVCPNDGNDARMYVYNWTEPAINLTLVSETVAV